MNCEIEYFGHWEVDEFENSYRETYEKHQNEDDLEEKLEKGQRRYGFFGDVAKLGIVGTPEQFIEKIKADVEKGISKYTIFFSDVMKKETLVLFANEVIPEFR